MQTKSIRGWRVTLIYDVIEHFVLFLTFFEFWPKESNDHCISTNTHEPMEFF